LNYENDLKENMKNIFKENEDYFLINSEWIYICKDCCSKIMDYYLNNVKHNKIEFKDNNFDDILNDMIEKKIFLNLEHKKIFEDIMNKEKIKSQIRKVQNIEYIINNYYIVNSQIMEKISKLIVLPDPKNDNKEIKAKANNNQDIINIDKKIIEKTNEQINETLSCNNFNMMNKAFYNNKLNNYDKILVLTKQLELTKKELSELKQDIKKKESVIKNQKEIIKNKEKDLEIHKDDMKNKVKEIENQNEIINYKDNEISKLKDDIKIKDNVIEGQKEEILKIKKENEEKDKEMNNLKNRIKNIIDELNNN